jgi:hypothetical protein
MIGAASGFGVVRRVLAARPKLWVGRGGGRLVEVRHVRWDPDWRRTWGFCGVRRLLLEERVVVLLRLKRTTTIGVHHSNKTKNYLNENVRHTTSSKKNCEQVPGN